MSQVLRTIRSSLPVIAKALSRKYNVLVEFGCTQACATRDRITLPALPAEDEKAQVLANGYIDHEAGHSFSWSKFLDSCR